MSAYRAKPPKGSLLQRGHPDARGLVAAWLFNEGTGDRVYDSAGRNTGTLAGGPTWATGPYGRDLSFDGVNDEVGLPDLSARVTSAASLLIWLRLTTHNPGNRGAWMGSVASGAQGANWYPFGDGNIYDGTFSSVRKTVGPGLIADRTQWHMVAITADQGANSWVFYQNAQVALASTLGTFVPPTAPFLGSSEAGNTARTYMTGAISHAYLFNVALPAAAIRRLAADPFAAWRRRNVPVPLHPSTAGGLLLRRRRLLAGAA